MEKIFKSLLIILFVGVCIGCAKNITKTSYTSFNEYFKNKKGYTILDNTSSYDINIRKSLEAGEGHFQIFYIEYDSEKNADEYINGLKEDKNIKIKKYDKYTYAENTKGRYMVLYKVDNIIVMGMTNDNKYKGQVNSVLKDLGY